MKKSFLDYYKTVLDKVSFDQQLFYKELVKALQTIDKHEVDDLVLWLRDQGLIPDLITIKSRSRSYLSK